MSKEETLKILALLDTAYRGRLSNGNAEVVAELWGKCLEKEDYDEVYNGVVQFMREDTTGYAPLPAQIIKATKKAKKNREVMELERKFMRVYTEPPEGDFDTGLDWLEENR